MKKTKIVSIKLSKKEKSKVDFLAASAGLNRSEMIRELIKSRRAPRQPRRQSFLTGDILNG